MKGSDLFSLCDDKEWPEARKYLSSDASEERKKSNIMYRNDDDYGTCLHQAFYRDPPDDIIKAMIDIGGKELVMKVDIYDDTVLNTACIKFASYDIIKTLIEVGGKDLVMAKNKCGYTALHWLCIAIKTHIKAAEKIKLILQAGDDTLLLSAKNIFGQTPLEIVTDKGASNIIKKLLAVQQMMMEEEGEAARAQKLLEVSNRRAADLEATVETQKLEIADLSNEKDGIEKECMDKIDKLTRKMSKEEKRKHIHEEHEEGEDTVVQSQTQSSKKRRVGNTINASSGSLNRNQAEGENAEFIDMLMTRYLDTRKQLQRANARIAQFEEEHAGT
jgi:hypothetical protein